MMNDERETAKANSGCRRQERVANTLLYQFAFKEIHTIHLRDGMNGKEKAQAWLAHSKMETA
jgi:hypothetical protein